MAGKTTKANTTMTIKEVVLLESGENAGDLVINIVAKRKRRTYKLPYQIKRANIPKVDMEYLKQRVLDDITALENEHAKEDVIIEKLQGLVGSSMKLD